jgi:hypothetical protein
VKGKIPFMPPEQIRGLPVTHGADLYALGVTFYWLLTGRRPFSGPNDAALMHSVLHDEPEPPSALNPSVPASLDAHVLRMLSKEPTQRPSTGAELAGELLDLVPANRAPLATFVKQVAALGPPPPNARAVPASVPTTDSLLHAVEPSTSPFKDVTVSIPPPEVASAEDRHRLTPPTHGADAIEPGTDTSYTGKTFGDLTVPTSPPWTARKAATLSLGVAAAVFVVAFFALRSEPDAPAPPPPPPSSASDGQAPAEARPAAPPSPLEPPPSAVEPPPPPAPGVDVVEEPPAAAEDSTSQVAESKPVQPRARRAAAKTRALSLVAPSSVRWSTAKGAKLGTGSRQVTVPANTRELIATDAKRGVTTRATISGDRVDYAKLPKGELDIRAFPYAVVTAGKTKLGTAPFPVVKVIAGRHTIRFKHEDKTIVRRVTVAPGKRVVVKVNMLKDN